MTESLIPSDVIVSVSTDDVWLRTDSTNNNTLKFTTNFFLQILGFADRLATRHIGCFQKEWGLDEN